MALARVEYLSAVIALKNIDINGHFFVLNIPVFKDIYQQIRARYKFFQ